MSEEKPYRLIIEIDADKKDSKDKNVTDKVYEVVKYMKKGIKSMEGDGFSYAFESTEEIEEE